MEHMFHILSQVESVRTLHFLHTKVWGCEDPVETSIPDLGIQSIVSEERHGLELTAPVLLKFIPSLKYTLTSLDTEFRLPRTSDLVEEQFVSLGRFILDAGPGLLDLRLEIIEYGGVGEYSLCIILLFIFVQLIRLPSTAFRQLLSALHLSACVSLRSFWLSLTSTTFPQWSRSPSRMK